MPDIVSSQTRSRMMAGIRGKDTKPELAIRKALHARGFRYVLHDRKLPGKPDISFPMYGSVILVNGCFWHGHDCHLFKWPSTRHDFWHEKITRNRQKDEENLQALKENGCRVLVIWECALKGRTRLDPDKVVDETEEWLLSVYEDHVIQGGKENSNRAMKNAKGNSV